MGDSNRRKQGARCLEGPFSFNTRASRLLSVNMVPIVPRRKHPPAKFDLATWYQEHQADNDVETLKTQYGR